MIARRALSALLATVVALMLASCAGLPTSGPVYPGQSADETTAPQDTIFLPDLPQPGASPEQIVEGFIRAGSGPTDGWSRAREFLAPDAEAWRPEAGVTIVLPGDRVYESSDDGTVTLSVVAVATVDDRGAYEPVSAGTTTLSFTLAEQGDGEWRITSAPDGIVLDRDVFPSVFNSYSVAYFDPNWQYLVPDVRWFPPTNAPTRIADALVNRPISEWLADAAVTAFPEGVTARASVPVESGVAQVELADAALGLDTITLDRMLTQLEASLATAGVTQVEMSVEQAPLDATSVATRSTRVATAPLVLTEEGFGFLSGEELSPIEGLSEVIVGLEPTAVQVGPDRDAAAARAGDGSVARVTSEGAETVDSRGGLVAPAIDPAGTVWSVPRSDPTALLAVTVDGARIDVAGAFPDAATVSAIAISRDGTRMAGAVTAGARRELWIAGVVRDGDGVPVRLTEPMTLGSIAGEPAGLAWLDDTTVGAVSAADDAGVLFDQIVGGPTSTVAAPAAITGLAGGATATSVRLLAEDGTLLVRRGSNWQESATGVLVLATQQGSPP